MRLLQIDSSITGPLSISRQLTASIVARLKMADTDLVHDYRDLAAAPLPYQTSPGAAQDGVTLVEFLAADIVVIGAPMYNFSIPSQLKSWIDTLAVPGKTFTYSAAGAAGLCGAKRIIVASSRGGFYTPPSPLAALDHQETYLTGFFGFLGVTNIAFVRAEGSNYGPEQRVQAIESALAQVATLA